MHDTCLAAGKIFAESYGCINKVVLDVGGKNVNGSLRSFFEELGMKYICLDIEEDASVDVVIKPGEKLPFDNSSIDLIVSTSCFEHDPCFWMTFKEMTRIVKLGGFIYVNAPSNGPYHGYPGDYWRFYLDSGQGLAYYSGLKVSNEEVFPVKVVETFYIFPLEDIWTDFACIWKRVDVKEEEITLSKDVIENIGLLEKGLNDCNYKTIKHC
jgi:SAM-dependent methyltransferase